jgi:hypothetical protein
MALLKVLSDHEWAEFVDDLFVRGNHVVIGYGFGSDFRALSNTHDAFKDIQLR